MSEPSDQPDLIPEESRVSSFMFVLSLLSAIGAVVAFFTAGFLAGLLGLAVTAVFLALGRALSYLQEIVFRLDRLEKKNEIVAKSVKPCVSCGKMIPKSYTTCLHCGTPQP